MNDRIRELAQQLLNTGFEDLPDRERRVIQRIADRNHISRNVNTEFRDTRSFGQRMADRVAEFGGSWTFIIISVALLSFWIIVNSLMLGSGAFDPFPYIFLNLLLSMLAALQAPIIMMSQNRQAAKDRLMAASDYEVNLKAEFEIMGLHEKLDQLRSDQLASLIKSQEQQIEMLTGMVRDLTSSQKP